MRWARDAGRTASPCGRRTCWHPAQVSLAVDPAPDAPLERCRAHVESCTVCGWRSGNYPDSPCVKCGGEVIVRGCEAWPVRGQAVCIAHGGKAPQARRVARKRLVEAGAEKELAQLDYEPVENPIEELADLGGRAKAVMELAFAKVAEGTMTQAHFDALGAAMDRFQRTLEAAHRAGLEERRVRLEEAQAQLVWAAVTRMLEQIGVPESQQQQALEVFEVAYAELEKANNEGGK